MAKDPRRGVRPGMDLLQVSATNAAAMNANEYFPGADSGHGNGFDPNVVHATINGCLHGRRYSERIDSSLELPAVVCLIPMDP